MSEPAPDGAPYPLSGVRVLDLSRVLAGPFAGRILESLGADVAKVEPPSGDVTRLWGDVRHGISGYYTQQNAGKRSLCIDLHAAGAAELVLELCMHVDIVIENFRPGVIERLGIGWSKLRKANPRLILLSISGYGQSGPESKRAAYAPVIHAEVGLLARQAEAERKAPADPMLSVADMNGGMHGVIATLSALFLRERTGLGQHIDLALYDSMLFTDDYAHFALDAMPVRLASGSVWNAPGGAIMLAGSLQHIWHSLAKRCHLVDPADPDSTRAEKAKLRSSRIQEYLVSFERRSDLVEALDRANLAWGEVRSTRAAFDSPTARVREVAPELDDRGGGTRRVVRAPYRFSAASTGTRRAAAYRGEHNVELLQEWLGASEHQIQQWTRNGILLREASCETADPAGISSQPDSDRSSNSPTSADN